MFPATRLSGVPEDKTGWADPRAEDEQEAPVTTEENRNVIKCITINNAEQHCGDRLAFAVLEAAKTTYFCQVESIPLGPGKDVRDSNVSIYVSDEEISFDRVRGKPDSYRNRTESRQL